jgi:hypothetical protein
MWGKPCKKFRPQPVLLSGHPPRTSGDQVAILSATITLWAIVSSDGSIGLIRRLEGDVVDGVAFTIDPVIDRHKQRF